MRLIDADVLLEEFKTRAIKARQWKESAILGDNHEATIRADATLAFITEIKLTIEGAPTVEPKKGKWILIKTNYDDGGNNFYKCSNCNHGDTHSGSTKVPYCWYCGADMREEQTDD